LILGKSSFKENFQLEIRLLENAAAHSGQICPLSLPRRKAGNINGSTARLSIAQSAKHMNLNGKNLQ
jgi:hypothetical protein